MKRNHLILLIILLVLIALYFILRVRQPLEKEIRFFKADSLTLAKIELRSVEDTIIVQKQNGLWRLTEPVKWEVNEDNLKTFFKDVLPIRTSSTPMSEDEKLQELYQVDEKEGIAVLLYDKANRLLDHAYIGVGDTAFDYGRHKNDKKIYQFKKNILNNIRPDIFQWRSPNITNLKAEQIDSINVVYRKNTYTLILKGRDVFYRDRKENFKISYYNRAHQKILNVLEKLMTYQFIDRDVDEHLKLLAKPDCSVTIYLKDKRIKTLTMVHKGEEGVVMIVDNNPETLYMMVFDFLNRFTRSAESFKAEYD